MLTKVTNDQIRRRNNCVFKGQKPSENTAAKSIDVKKWKSIFKEANSEIKS